MRYTDALLDSLRFEGDPAADAIIDGIALRGETAAVNAALRGLIRNDQAVPAALPDEVETWFRETGHLPAMAEPDRLAHAQALFVDRGLQMSFIFATASLVWCYADAKGVRVLTYTYRMGQDPYRRAAETAQFILDVLSPNGVGPAGHGIRAAQKVRLMHAAIRHLIRATGSWPEGELGVPICQEDLLATHLSFSHVVVEGLQQFGVKLTPAEIEDYFHIWRVVGELLGIRPEVIPNTSSDAHDLATAIARRQFAASPEGVTLTRALLEMHGGLMPGEVFDGLTPSLVRKVVGDQIADWLEVPHSRWDHVVRHYGTLGQALEFVGREHGSLGDLVDQVGLGLLGRASIAAAGYRRTGFEIPADLGDRWRLRATDVRVSEVLEVPAAQPAATPSTAPGSPQPGPA